MKKSVFTTIVALLVAMLLSGCGSNSKQDPIVVSPYLFINASTPLMITEGDKEYQITVQLIEQGFGFPGQVVKMRPFDRIFGLVLSDTAITDADGWAAFTYRSPTNFQQVSGQSVTLQAVYIDDENASVLAQNFVLNFAVVPEGNLYFLVNQSTPIIVDENSTSKEISAYVVNRNNVGVEGKTVTTTILNQTYGSITPASVETDASGKASFTYTGPVDITPLIGSTASINLNYTENEATSSLPVTIKIEAPQPAPPPIGSLYHLANQTTPVNVDTNNSVQQISVYVLDAQNNGAEAKTVTASTLDPAYGAVAPASAQTDASGKASFTYTGPADITPVIDTNTTLNLSYTENGATTSVPVTVAIVQP